eukprot:CAMPEP_0202878548 /NCGR_PEP_ID=MMETSP1391-20130828/32351_1 /ASSEMBLY_ACC=CAM_ASM_000867 /TAXON_ID=1034604 /ORGANISM="Chlamydomonas leiostraca, Strain SAG 11-49" /LENGTH=41 /DNA_ID= /DNA_START= /DNA_END= /DNA_ORIENTATION=
MCDQYQATDQQQHPHPARPVELPLLIAQPPPGVEHQGRDQL